MDGADMNVSVSWEQKNERDLGDLDSCVGGGSHSSLSWEKSFIRPHRAQTEQGIEPISKKG